MSDWFFDYGVPALIVLLVVAIVFIVTGLVACAFDDPDLLPGIVEAVNYDPGRPSTTGYGVSSNGKAGVVFIPGQGDKFSAVVLLDSGRRIAANLQKQCLPAVGESVTVGYRQALGFDSYHVECR